MKILYSLNGEGLGHAFAALSILPYLKGHEVLLLTWGGAVQALRSRGYKVVETVADFEVHRDGDDVDWGKTTSVLSSARKALKSMSFERKAFESFKPDVVVSDGRISTSILASIYRVPLVNIGNQFSNYEALTRGVQKAALKASTKLLFKSGELAGSTILVRDFPPPWNVSDGLVDYRKLKNLEFVGPCIIWPKTWRARRGKRKLVLCSLSGSGLGKSLVEQVYKASRQLKDVDFVAFASNQPLKLKETKNFQVVSKFTDADLFDYYSRADCYVGMPGHNAIMQCLCFGVPVVLAHPRNHLEQMVNAETVERKGAGICLGPNPSDFQVLEGLQVVLGERRFAEGARRYAGLYAKMNGARNASKIIIGRGARKKKGWKSIVEKIKSKISL